MHFDRSDTQVTLAQIAGVETALGLTLPAALKAQYLQSNGGDPVPCVYNSDDLETVINEFLPIASKQATRTVATTYRLLVLDKKLAATSFLPFAVDVGGDYFFVDCSTPEGMVYFYASEAPDGEDPMMPLGVAIADFWDKLEDE